MKTLIAGNWKMNGSIQKVEKLCKGLVSKIADHPSVLETCEFLVCPAFVHIPYVKQEFTDKNATVTVGGQDCASTDNGAFTGDISAAMLADTGCEYVILGHSERRTYHNETSQQVALKAEKAHEHGLKTIICVGEREEDRDAGKEEDVVREQLEKSLPKTATDKNTVIAYEPVWAIGTGKTATAADIDSMHNFIMGLMNETLADVSNLRILYGGSVKPKNAAEIFAVKNVHGGLIGGASLKADDFVGIAKAAEKLRKDKAA